MRIILLADLHGNLPATLAMGSAIERLTPDETWFLGDAVGKGPDNAETCDWVRAHCTRFVGGNWDYGIGGREYPADSYYWNQLGEERMRWLRTLPREAELTLCGRRFRVFHGRPVTELLTAGMEGAKLAEPFRANGQTWGGVIFADSHRPFVRALDTGYIANTGSVGNSLGVPRAHALMLEGDESPDTPLMMTVVSVPYDTQAAVDRAMADDGLPFRDSYIKEITTGVYAR